MSVLEAMADAGVKQGLPRDLAYKLAAKTMVGAGSMVLKTGIHFYNDYIIYSISTLLFY